MRDTETRTVKEVDPYPTFAGGGSIGEKVERGFNEHTTQVR